MPVPEVLGVTAAASVLAAVAHGRVVPAGPTTPHRNICQPARRGAANPLYRRGDRARTVILVPPCAAGRAHRPVCSTSPIDEMVRRPVPNDLKVRNSPMESYRARVET